MLAYSGGLRVAALFLVPFLIAACSKRAEIPDGLQGSGTFSGGPEVGPSPACRLLRYGEVDLALNQQVTSHNQTARPLMVGMQMCDVGQGNSSQLVWGILSRSAQESFANYVKVNSDYLEPVEIEADRAYWDVGLKTLVAKKGAAVVAIKLVVDPKVLEKRLNVREYTTETAKLLAQRALARLP